MKQESPALILVSLSAVLFLIHQYLQLGVQFHIAFLDNYLDPIVLMPLLLYAVLWERRILLRDRHLVLSYTDILGYFLLVVLLGEVLFPLISDRFTADYWDIPAYAFGTLAYVIAGEVSNLKKKEFLKLWLVKTCNLKPDNNLRSKNILETHFPIQ